MKQVPIISENIKFPTKVSSSSKINSSSTKPQEESPILNPRKHRETKTHDPEALKDKIDQEAGIVSATRMRKVLVHGICSYPIEKTSEANFSPIVHGYLKRERLVVFNGFLEALLIDFFIGNFSMKNPFRIQQYAWPNVLEFSSFIAVGRSYKTTSYLPGICSLTDYRGNQA
jgi:hypothetical protein